MNIPVMYQRCSLQITKDPCLIVEPQLEIQLSTIFSSHPITNIFFLAFYLLMNFIFQTEIQFHILRSVQILAEFQVAFTSKHRNLLHSRKKDEMLEEKLTLYPVRTLSRHYIKRPKRVQSSPYPLPHPAMPCQRSDTQVVDFLPRL